MLQRPILSERICLAEWFQCWPEEGKVKMADQTNDCFQFFEHGENSHLYHLWLVRRSQWENNFETMLKMPCSWLQTVGFTFLMWEFVWDVRIYLCIMVVFHLICYKNWASHHLIFWMKSRPGDDSVNFCLAVLNTSTCSSGGAHSVSSEMWNRMMFAHVLSRQFGTSSRCYRDNKTIGLLVMLITDNDDFIGNT